MDNLQEKYSSLLKRLAAVRNKEKLVSLLSGLINFVSVGMAAILFLVLLEYIFGFKSSGRIAWQLRGFKKIDYWQTNRLRYVSPVVYGKTLLLLCIFAIIRQ